MKIGAAMMVKGNADLGPAIDSLRRSVDDGWATLALCVDERHGHSVVDGIPPDIMGLKFSAEPFEMWTDTCIHMAANRNRSIDYCPADWVVLLDADETIHGPVRDAVERADRRGCNALYADILEHVGGEHVRTFRQVRAIRKGAVRYQYPVHNQLLWIGAKTAHRDPRVTVKTYYPADPLARHPRSYPALLKLWRTPDPHPTTCRELEKGHAAFYLTRLAAQKNFAARAYKWARRAVSIAPGRYPAAWRIGSSCAHAAHGWDEAAQFALRGIQATGFDPDLCHAMTRLWFLKWAGASSDPASIPVSAPYLENIKEASDLLGFGL